MKHKILALTLVLLASAAIGSAARSPNVPINLTQITTTPDIFYFRGPVNIQYQLSVTNPTDQPLKLSRLQIESIGPGAYSIHSTSTPMNLKLAPNETRTMTISVWGRARGGFLSADEPVTIHGTAYFNGASGSFVRMFNENFMQR